MSTIAKNNPSSSLRADWVWRFVSRDAVSKYLLIGLLLALPLYYAIGDVAGGEGLAHIGVNLTQGLSNGLVWALIAVGYTLVYGIIGLINFAHGNVFMLGSFVAAGMIGVLGLSGGTGVAGLVGGIGLILLICMVVCGLLNVMIERVGYRPLREAPLLSPLITSVGFLFILQDVGQLWLGSAPDSVPDLIGVQRVVFELGGVPIYRADLFALVTSVPLIVGVALFVKRGRLGKAMRATSQDRIAARLVGINVDSTVAVAFLLGGLLAGTAGLVYALYQTTVWFFAGFQAGLIGFTAAVMGGIGSLGGAVAGGLIIGCIQQISDNRIGSEWTPAIVFAYLIVIIVLRPRGLVAEQTREGG